MQVSRMLNLELLCLRLAYRPTMIFHGNDQNSNRRQKPFFKTMIVPIISCRCRRTVWLSCPVGFSLRFYQRSSPFLSPSIDLGADLPSPATCHCASPSASINLLPPSTAGCLLATSFHAAELDQIRTLEGKFVSAVVDVKGSVLVSVTKGKHPQNSNTAC